MTVAAPMSRQRIRVACTKCGAHRDKTLAPDCLVCSATGYVVVAPTAGDVSAILEEAIAAAELVDVVVHAADAGHVIGTGHPAFTRLREAMRRLALARAGCLAC